MSDNTVVTENDITSVVEVTSAGPAGPPGGALTIQDQGVDEGLLTDKINFVGSTVSVVNDTIAEIATITVDAADPRANTNITSLGGITGGISSPDYVQFDTAATVAGAVGRLLWNDTDGTLEFQLKGGNVTLQIGQEQVIRVTNTAGVTMTDGQAVYITGSTGNHLNVTLAQANAEATSSKTLAVVTETIANNKTGFATSSGLVRGLDTSALTEGAAIWLSPTVPGGLTTTRPTAPDHAVLIGWCVRQSATVGAIYVHIANGYELDELHDVLITAAANNQVLRYDAATSLWKNATISPTLTLTGDVSGSATFTDLGNATLTATVADDSHNHIISNVDGLQDALDSKLPAASYTAADVLTKIKTVDGTGSGLDADLLDGQSSAYYTAINDRLGYTAENAANKGVAGGYASLDGAGLVPSTQLPSYVDDVLEFDNLAAFPATGESGKIYVAVDTSKTYRWSGSTYVEISASPGSTDAVPEGSTNLYFTTARARGAVSAGTGVSYDSGTGVITNAAPDQTVSITGSGTTTVTGTYPNFTVSSADQYVGTVTSVSGTGTVNGLTLTGTVTSSGSLTLGGTLSVDLSTATVTGTLPVTKGGIGATSLTSGYLVKGNGTSAVSASVVYDDGTNVGIGTSSPGYKLVVNGGDFLVSRGSGATAADAAINFGGNSNNYIYSGNSSNIMAFATNGSERMRITSAGNIGINTSSPANKLDVNGTMGASAYLLNSSSHLIYDGSSTEIAFRIGASGPYYGIGTTGSDTMRINSASGGDMLFAIGGTERMRIDSSGNVGIGTSSPALNSLSLARGAGVGASIEIAGNGTTPGSTALTLSHASDSAAYVWNRSNAIMSFGTNNTERARIDSSGNLLVGTTTNGGVGLSVAVDTYGRSVINNTTYDSGFAAEQFRYDGTTVGTIQINTTSTAYNTSSDARLKHDIVDAPEVSSLIDAIKVRSFKWNADNSEQRYGMVAQELLEVAPEAVSVPADEEQMMGVDYSKLVPMLVKEIQSLRARVAQLEGN